MEIRFLPKKPDEAIKVLERIQNQFPVTHSQYGKIQEQIDNYKIKHKIGVRIPQGNTIK